MYWKGPADKQIPVKLWAFNNQERSLRAPRQEHHILYRGKGIREGWILKKKQQTKAKNFQDTQGKTRSWGCSVWPTSPNFQGCRSPPECDVYDDCGPRAAGVDSSMCVYLPTLVEITKQSMEEGKQRISLLVIQEAGRGQDSFRSFKEADQKKFHKNTQD